MADISKIKLPDGVTYDIKDAVARASAGGATVFFKKLASSNRLNPIKNIATIGDVVYLNLHTYKLDVTSVSTNGSTIVYDDVTININDRTYSIGSKYYLNLMSVYVNCNMVLRCSAANTFDLVNITYNDIPTMMTSLTDTPAAPYTIITSAISAVKLRLNNADVKHINNCDAILDITGHLYIRVPKDTSVSSGFDEVYVNEVNSGLNSHIGSTARIIPEIVNGIGFQYLGDNYNNIYSGYTGAVAKCSYVPSACAVNKDTVIGCRVWGKK